MSLRRQRRRGALRLATHAVIRLPSLEEDEAVALLAAAIATGQSASNATGEPNSSASANDEVARETDPST